VGRIGKPHGVRGEVTVEELTDNPDRFRAGATFVLEGRTLTIDSLRRHRGALLLRFAGVADRESAEALRGAVLTIEAADRRSLGGDEFWPDQLEGLQALLPDGTRLGTVTGVAFGPAQDRLLILTTSGTTIEIPFVEELVSDVHPSGGFVVVDPPPGLD
jgi:16S rRNA processing protein RimM